MSQVKERKCYRFWCVNLNLARSLDKGHERMVGGSGGKHRLANPPSVQFRKRKERRIR